MSVTCAAKRICLSIYFQVLRMSPSFYFCSNFYQEKLLSSPSRRCEAKQSHTIIPFCWRAMETWRVTKSERAGRLLYTLHQTLSEICQNYVLHLLEFEYCFANRFLPERHVLERQQHGYSMSWVQMETIEFVVWVVEDGREQDERVQ